MDLKFWLEILLILGLLLISGYFAASEISLIAIRKSRVRELIEAGVKKAEFIEKLRSDPDRFFAVVQVGKTITDSAASALGGATAVIVIKPLIYSIPIPAIQQAAGTISIISVVVVISFLFLVLAELVPKAMAIRRTESIALWVGPVMWWLSKVLGLFVGILSWSANVVLRLFGISHDAKRDSALTEEEVKILLREGLQHGVFEQSEQEMIHSVFEFADSVARNIMTPRTEVVAVEISDSPEKILNVATIEQYSRLPVYDENLDNIKGLIHVRDLLNVFQENGLIIVKDIMRPPLFVPDSKKISEVLHDMQRKRTHMAIVLDEFGGTAGLITLEDILEEIVGEIQDEYDEEDNDIITRSDGSLIVDGAIDADIICKKFNVDCPEGEFQSVAGMIIHAIGHIPALDESVELSGMKMTVIEKEGHRVRRVKVEKIESQS